MNNNPPLKGAQIPVGPNLAKYLGWSDQQLSNAPAVPLREKDYQDFAAYFLQVLEEKPISNFEHLVDILDELIAMNLPLLVLKTKEIHQELWHNEDFRAELIMGIAYMLIQDFDMAQEHFFQANQLMPEEPAPYVNMALILNSIAQDQEAWQWCLAGLEKDKNNLKLWKVIGPIAFQIYSHDYKNQLMSLAKKINSWVGVSMSCAQFENMSSHEICMHFKELYDLGEMSTDFLLEYTAHLGSSNQFEKIPAIIWKARKKHKKNIPAQLIFHEAQALFGLKKNQESLELLNTLNSYQDYNDDLKFACENLIQNLQEELMDSPQST